MARKTCWDCVIKHIGQASALLDESVSSYDFHRGWAIGHLAEAESESLERAPEFAAKIRAYRLLVSRFHERFSETGIEGLMREAWYNAGYPIEQDPSSNKMFDDTFLPEHEGEQKAK